MNMLRSNGLRALRLIRRNPYISNTRQGRHEYRFNTCSPAYAIFSTVTWPCGQVRQPYQPKISPTPSEIRTLNPFHSIGSHQSRTPASPWNVANAITVGRIVAAPVTGYWIFNAQYDYALGGLLYAGISDWLDGVVARRFKLQTVIGSYLDPLADKLLVSTTTTCLALKGVIPLYLVGMIVGRDLALVGGWMVLVRRKTGGYGLSKLVQVARGNALEPLYISKVNTALQISLGFSGVLYAGEWGVVSDGLLRGLGLVTVASTVASGTSYAARFLRPLPAS